ncbi:hypothetical protein LMG24238_00111 [Paraburkholderia sediminicola]|uniref:Uncharacterized protein n=1 Tax=Paraburkholderia sediminicola TaxID=458836 RepID=A0A6J4ZPZ8_9BURK|nr:hypothetical protein LMG24238_00111 [Paraburkholderia sediminicola]
MNTVALEPATFAASISFSVPFLLAQAAMGGRTI